MAVFFCIALLGLVAGYHYQCIGKDLYVCLSTCLSVCLYVFLSVFRLSMCLSIFLSIYMFVYCSMILFVYLSINILKSGNQGQRSFRGRYANMWECISSQWERWIISKVGGKVSLANPSFGEDRDLGTGIRNWRKLTDLRKKSLNLTNHSTSLSKITYSISMEHE